MHIIKYIILYIYLNNFRYVRQNLVEIPREIDNSTTIMREFNIALSIIDRSGGNPAQIIKFRRTK